MISHLKLFAIALLFLFSSATLFSSEQELLKKHDVNNIMHQIFQQHVQKKEISKEILKNSFNVFLNQFDADKTYFLESETHLFLYPTDEEMSGYIDQYKNSDFSSYDHLNAIIQKAIVRNRELRTEIEKDLPTLFAEAKHLHNTHNNTVYADPNTNIPIAKTSTELKGRIYNQIASFIHAEIHHFGEPAVMNRQKQIIDLYEKQLRHHENQYLFLTDEGYSLPSTEKENIVTLHILKALANSLDSHTAFFNASEAYDMRVHLEKELHGIGVALQQGIDGAVIYNIIPEGPAAKTGLIKVNDEIIEIDGRSIVGEPFENVMDMIRGEDGSSIALKIKRKNGLGQASDQLISLTLKREPIIMNNDRVDISYETFGNGIIGKLVLHSFYQGENGISSEKDMRDAIHQLKKQGNLRGLIVDLRENGGGFLTQAIKVAGLFITNGVVVISKYSNGEIQYYRDIDNKIEYNGPLIILTSKATASAAEIVAQALQDYGVALIIGDERTYGKGSIQSQTVTDHKSSSFFKVTVGKYYTVSGKSPQIKGVLADIVAPSQLNHEHLGEKFLEYPLSYDTISPAFNDTLQDVDPQYKPWFLKYYTPTLQHPTQEWKKMVPILKKNSAYRIDHNKNYQFFLKKIQANNRDTEDDDEDSALANNTQKNFGNEDLQMNEAINIMKDMIVLHFLWNSYSVGIGSLDVTAISK